MIVTLDTTKNVGGAMSPSPNYQLVTDTHAIVSSKEKLKRPVSSAPPVKKPYSFVSVLIYSDF